MCLSTAPLQVTVHFGCPIKMKRFVVVNGDVNRFIVEIRPFDGTGRLVDGQYTLESYMPELRRCGTYNANGDNADGFDCESEDAALVDDLACRRDNTTGVCFEGETTFCNTSTESGPALDARDEVTGVFLQPKWVRGGHLACSHAALRAGGYFTASLSHRTHPLLAGMGELL